jgi:peptide/nickel transport system substrate-binding protein
MRNPRRLGLASLLMSVTLLSSACAPAGLDGSQSGQSASGGTGSTAEISFQLYQKPTSFDPFHAVTYTDTELAALQFLPLLTYQDGKYIPRLAKSWESSDAQNFTIVLNDAKWSDGSPITANDVAFTFQTYLNTKVAAILGGPLSIIQGAADFKAGKATSVSGLQVVDDKTLKIALTTPNLAFLASITEMYIVPKAVYSGIAPDQLKGNEALRSPSLSSGAYMFSKWISDDSVELVANPKALYKAQAAKLYAKYLTGDVAEAQLQTGEIDIADVPATDVKSLKDKGVTIVTKPGNKVMTLHTALPNGKLADKKVRQAIMYAIDRKAIIDSVLAGNGKVAGSMLFAPDWAQDPQQNEYAYDPAKAKALLAEAGWKADTKVQLDIVPGQADRDAVFRIIVGELQAVGINAVITTHQTAETSAMISSNAFDLLITPLTMGVPEPATINNRELCDQRAPAGINITGYCNPALDKLLLEGMKTTDQAKRQEIYQQVTKILNEEVPQFPLYVADLNTGTAKTIKGFDNQPNPFTVVADKWSK